VRQPFRNTIIAAHNYTAEVNFAERGSKIDIGARVWLQRGSKVLLARRAPPIGVLEHHLLSANSRDLNMGLMVHGAPDANLDKFLFVAFCELESF
jgi:hypothetical protein